MHSYRVFSLHHCILITCFLSVLLLQLPHTYAATITLGAQLTLTGPNAQTGPGATAANFREGTRFMVKWLNENTGNTPINGETLQFVLKEFDDQGLTTDPELCAQLAQQMVADPEVDFILVQLGGTAGVVGAPIYEAAGRFVIDTVDTLPVAHVYGNLFASLTTFDQFFQASLLVTRLKGARSVATVTTEAVNGAVGCAGMDSLAPRLGLDFVGEFLVSDIPLGGSCEPVAPAVEEVWRTQLSALVATQPDVVVLCPPFARLALAILRDLDYSPGAILLTFPQGLEACDWDPHLASVPTTYVSYSVPWHPLMRLPGDDLIGTPADFEALWLAAHNDTPSTTFAQLGATGPYLYYLAMRSADSTEPAAVRRALSLLFADTWFSPFRFDITGVNIAHRWVGVQIQPEGELPFAPIENAFTELVYPMPTWQERQYEPGWFEEGGEIAIAVMVGVAMLLLLCVGAGLAYCWRHPVMRAGTPEFLALILVGGLALLSAVFTWMLYVTTAACIARPWLLALGFDLMFGSLLAKSWRVSKVFLVSGLKRVKVTMLSALLLLGAIMLVDVVLLSIWMGVSTPHAETVVVDPVRPSQNYEQCAYSLGSDGVFIILLLAYHALLVVYSLYMAYQLRTIKWVVFNESKWILFAMYNLVLVVVVIIIVEVVDIDREAQFYVRSVFIVVGVLLSVAAVFLFRFYMIRVGAQYDDGSFRADHSLVSRNTQMGREVTSESGSSKSTSH
mmetsp:Transcript_7349/g.22572  ORF Transcript_7349/g.22572 Transcript_7349/m.22572 type:complete len:733 (+) Transcript_7349:193-2391(+)